MKILIRMADALGCSWLEPDSLAGGTLIRGPIHQSDQRFNGFGYDRQPGRPGTPRDGVRQHGRASLW